MKNLSAIFLCSLLAACAPPTDPMEARVSALIEGVLGDRVVQQKAYSDLEALGEPGIPYFVGHLKDYRELSSQRISLENNSPDAFESYRHYSPDTVHDALAAILNQLTGKSFESVYNGASPAEREKNRREWVSWCKSKYPEKVATCNGT